MFRQPLENNFKHIPIKTTTKFKQYQNQIAERTYKDFSIKISYPHL